MLLLLLKTNHWGSGKLSFQSAEHENTVPTLVRASFPMCSLLLRGADRAQLSAQLRVFVGDTQEGHLCGSGCCHGVELRGILKMMVCSGRENMLSGVSCQEINPLIGHQL